MDELIAALKGGADAAKCGKWKAWRDAQTGECYVQPSDKEPRSGLDEFILESSDAAALVAAVNERCGKETKPPEKPSPPETPTGSTPVTGCDWILPVEIQNAIQIPNVVGWFLGAVDAQGKPIPPAPNDKAPWLFSWLTKFLRDQLVLSSGKLTDAFNAILRSNPCIGGANVALITMRAVVNFVSVFVGDSLSQVKVPLTQHSNFLCPVGMPDYGAATQAWLTNAISEETRNCWTRACGMRDDLWSICAEAQRSRLGPDQLVRLLYRGELTPAEFAARVRELGYIRESDPVELAELGRQIPGPADLVRFMLRDVADPQIVERFGLDASFADKFQGNLVKQARAQGLDPETMRDYWRAHWSIPSPTQLYEMFHRLRGLEPGDPLRVSLEDVRAALEQADILPFWIDKLLEVSFRPLRLVDTRRAYFQGSIDRQEVRRVYQATGYSDRDAEILTRFQGREKVDAFIRGPWGKKYLLGAVSGQQLQRKAIAQGFTGEEMVYIRDGLVELLEAQRKAKCTGNIRRRQLRGELDKISAATELQNLGLDGDQAIQLAETWACEKATRGKEFQGSQLCKLYAEGLIDGPEFVRRLEKAGWERDDAVRLYTLCSRDLERKRRAEEIRILRQQEAEAEKAARKAQQAAKGLETAAKQQEAERDRLAKLNQARNRVLTDAGAAWAKRFGDDLSDSIGRARLTYRSIADTTTIPKDAIIRAVYTAAKSPSVESTDQWITEALAIAQGQVETTTPSGISK
jgi:hypothetical protein